MVAPMKERGLEEVQSARKRIGRLYALKRVTEADFNYIDQRLREVEARVEIMRERGTGEEAPF